MNQPMKARVVSQEKNPFRQRFEPGTYLYGSFEFDCYTTNYEFSNGRDVFTRMSETQRVVAGHFSWWRRPAAPQVMLNLRLVH